MELTPKAQNYLKAIAELSAEKPLVRQIDVARRLNVQPSSCFSAVLGLIRKQYVYEDDRKSLCLSAKAKSLVALLERHGDLLEQFFTDVLDVPKEQAKMDASVMQHHVSIDTSIRLCKFLRFMNDVKHESVWKSVLADFKVDTSCEPACVDCPQKEACAEYNRL